MANPKPVAEVPIGRVKATAWPNETEGRTRHNVRSVARESPALARPRPTPAGRRRP